MKNKIQVFTDGAARGNPGPAGIGVAIKSKDKTIKEVFDYIGETTNNVAEYTALLRGLEETLILEHKEAHFYSDSELLVKQITGEYRVKNEKLKPLFMNAKLLIKRFKKFSISHVRREQNKEADLLANQGIDSRSTGT
ncbi:MAG: ribonuclease HI family protein [Candidatus Saganbacteria bacterium]|nr:ribonuclease HI family protein [Candidatus Saganbacteria bacterium]